MIVPPVVSVAAGGGDVSDGASVVVDVGSVVVETSVVAVVVGSSPAPVVVDASEPAVVASVGSSVGSDVVVVPPSEPVPHAANTVTSSIPASVALPHTRRNPAVL